MTTVRRIILLSIIALSPAAAMHALGHGDGKMPGPFLQRHAVMGSLAAHMKATKAAIATEEFKAAATHADAIYWLARIVPDTFPEGSGPNMGKTRAAPKIWQDWAGFTAASRRLAETAAELRQAAKSDNESATKAAFATVAKSGCGGCHKVYRTAKQ